MGKDRFLWGILLAIAVLAALAVVLFLTRQDQQVYVSEETPEGVVHNYVLALDNKDFRRAYSYLREGAGKPDYERFRQDFVSLQMGAANASLQIGATQLFEREAVVALVVVRGRGGPFEDVYREQSSALLEKDESGAWKIAGMPNPYWGWDWYNPQLIKPVPAVPGD